MSALALPNPGAPMYAALLLERLDVPDCRCKPVRVACACGWGCDHPPYYLPCEHLLQTWHTLTLEEWHQLCLALFPESYKDPDTPPPAPRIVSRRGRVAVYRERVEQGYHLYRADDLWRRCPLDDRIRAGAVLTNAPNGTPVQTDLVAVSGFPPHEANHP